ncbi:hypothetical protein [Microbacterium sp. NPDC096154]|uniref:hypothetical protein n=1 Tax=Microbacterium sp. NPDC096154 TaxID=3155549 RepID=UPI003322D63A
MNRVKLTYIVSAILCAGLLAIGWIVGISPLIAGASSADAERDRIVADNSVLELRLAQLGQVQAELDEHRAELADLRRAMPSEGAYDAYLDEISGLARGTGVVIDRITFGDAAPFGATAGAAPAPTDAAGDAPATEGTTDPATTSAPTDPSGGTAATPATPAVAGGLLSIPVQVGVTGPGDSVRRFIDALQSGDRYTLVSKVSLSSEEDAGDVLDVAATALLDGFVWVLPE